MKKIILKVNGMVCNGCENRVKNALKNIDGVKSISANYKNGIVSITTEEEIEKSLFENKIIDLGYEIVKED